MNKGRRNKPGIATYGDHEVITPPGTLRHALVATKPGAADPVAQAEAALKLLAGDFASWMSDECERLERARQAIKSKGIDKARRDALYYAAHDIRGQAATYGYPLAAAGADSLCRLLEHAPDANRIPMALIDQHADSVRAIVREYTRTDIVQVAAALTQRLRLVTDEFLARENKDRPEVIAALRAPSITPGF
jgi:HPt (histidine-containing phosphotransfer) domain-containing protein